MKEDEGNLCVVHAVPATAQHTVAPAAVPVPTRRPRREETAAVRAHRALGLVRAVEQAIL